MSHDLAEHTSTLVALLGIFATLAGILFWRLITKIDNKLDQWLTIHEACKTRQEDERKELSAKIDNEIKEIQQVRHDDWQRYFWSHIHGEDKEVKVPRQAVPLK